MIIDEGQPRRGWVLVDLSRFLCQQLPRGEVLPVCRGHPGPGRDGPLAGGPALGSSVLPGPRKAAPQSPGAVVGPCLRLAGSVQN